MAKTTLIVSAAFAAVLLIAAWLRMGDEARAMMLGSICGITASIPVTVAMVLANMRFTRSADVPAPKSPAVQGAVVIVKCKHDTNLMEMRCPVCELEGVRYLPTGPRTWD